MDKITEARISSLLASICKAYGLLAEYQEGSPLNGRCWRVTFMHGAERSYEMVGLTRREIYDLLYAFWRGMDFAVDISGGRA